VRVNTISAGPLGSRAAKAIGFIDDMIRWVGRWGGGGGGDERRRTGSGPSLKRAARRATRVCVALCLVHAKPGPD